MKRINVLFGAKTKTRPVNQAITALSKNYKLTYSPLNASSILAAIQREDTRKENAVDVLVVDIAMPTRSGTEILARIKKESRQVPLVVITSSDRVKSPLLDLADDVVFHPIKPGELRFRIGKVLRIRGRAHVEDRAPSAPSSLSLVPELHDPVSGRIDAKLVAKYLDVPLTELSKAIGSDYKAVFKTPSSPSVQSGLEPIHRTILALHRYFARRKESLVWLSSPNPELDSNRPRQLILEGKGEIVADMLDGALAGVTT